MTVLLDDHLLRDWLAGPDQALLDAIGHDVVATTNLWYVRLCKSAANRRGGALLGGWSDEERDAIIGGLLSLDDAITVKPLRELAWRMGVLSAEHSGVSSLGAEAVAAAETLDASVLVSSRDDGPGIRACCQSVGVGYRALPR